MNGKLRKLKDSIGSYIYPITRGEAVFVTDTKNLIQKLSEIESSINNTGGNTVMNSYVNRIISDNNMTYFGATVDTLSGKTYSVKHTVRTPSYDIRLVYGNFHSADIGTGNDITIKSSIVYNGEFYPVTFYGSNQIVLSSGAVVFSDPISMDLLSGETIETRTYVSATTGGLIPYRKTYSTSSQGIATGDLTLNGSIPQATGNIYAPLSIIGSTTSEDKPTFVLIGDSNMEGAGGKGDGGWAVKSVSSNSYSYTNIGKAGQKLTDFLGAKKRNRSSVVPYANFAITCYGTNDLSTATLTSLQNNYLKIWNELKNKGVKKIFANTIFPKVDNTTKLPTEYETLRVQFNDWLRTVPAPLTGIIDAADVVETSRNSGVWIDTYYFDGVHTNDAGHTAIANSINPSIFTLK